DLRHEVVRRILFRAAVTSGTLYPSLVHEPLTVSSYGCKESWAKIGHAKIPKRGEATAKFLGRRPRTSWASAIRGQAYPDGRGARSIRARALCARWFSSGDAAERNAGGLAASDGRHRTDPHQRAARGGGQSSFWRVGRRGVGCSSYARTAGCAGD